MLPYENPQRVYTGEIERASEDFNAKPRQLKDKTEKPSDCQLEEHVPGPNSPDWILIGVGRQKPRHANLCPGRTLAKGAQLTRP